MTLLYHALIKPHLLYAIILWGSTCSTLKNYLGALQNRNVRAIAGFQRMQLISPTYSKIDILKLDNLCKHEIANFMLKYSNNTVPKPSDSIFILSTDIHSHYTRSISHLNNYFSSFKILNCTGHLIIKEQEFEIKSLQF